MERRGAGNGGLLTIHSTHEVLRRSEDAMRILLLPLLLAATCGVSPRIAELQRGHARRVGCAPQYVEVLRRRSRPPAERWVTRGCRLQMDWRCADAETPCEDVDLRPYGIAGP
jgi:hypothetical protein